MMPRLRHNLPTARGTTILELILYIGIISLLITAVVAFSVDMLATSLKADASAEAAWNARFAVGRLAAEIRQAGGYDVANSVFTANPSKLILCPASLSACTAATGTVFTVSPTTGQLTAAVSGGTAQPLTSSRVTVAGFTIVDLSTDPDTTIRSRNFAITIRTVYKGSGLWTDSPEATYQTTERIRRAEGFAN
jgi:Tfp pilus assembly protein PilW